MSAQKDSGDSAKPPPERKASSPDAKSSKGEPTDPSKLSKEEQMALYEKDLKENDWGHQPC